MRVFLTVPADPDRAWLFRLNVVPMTRLSILIHNYVGEDPFGGLLRIAFGSIPSPSLDLDRYRRIAVLLQGAVDTHLISDLNGAKKPHWINADGDEAPPNPLSDRSLQLVPCGRRSGTQKWLRTHSCLEAVTGVSDQSS